MRILLLHNRDQKPSDEDVAVHVEAELLDQHGHEVCLAEVDNADTGGFFPQMRTAAEAIYSPGARRRVAKKIAGFGADIVHVHSFFPLLSPSVYYACREAGVPVVQTLHNYRLICPNGVLFRGGHVCEECVGRSFAWPAIEHACYRGSRVGTASIATMQTAHHISGTWRGCVDTYIALTDFSREKFVQGGFPADKIIVKPNVVLGDPRKGDGRGGYALFVGRLSSEKGIDVMLAAWQHLRDRMPLRIVGDGPLSERVRAAAVDGISYLGPCQRKDVLKLMRDAALLVFPSLCYETFGMVIAEAFAAGLPVIASNLGSPASLVTHGRTGLLFRSGDSTSLTEQMEWVLSHPEELSRMRHQSRAEYEEKYTPDRNYELLLRIYNRAIKTAKCDTRETVAVTS